MRTAGDDDVFPTYAGSIRIQELFPVPLRMGLAEPTDKLKGSFHHAVGLRDIDGIAEVFAGGGFEPDFGKEEVILWWLAGVEFSEPAAGVVDLDAMQSVTGSAIEERLVVAHEPDDELAAWGDSGVDAGVLDVVGFTVFAEDKIDLGVFFGAWVDLAGPSLELVELGLALGDEIGRDAKEGGGKKDREAEHGMDD